MQKPANRKATFEDLSNPDWIGYILYQYRDLHLQDKDVIENLGITRQTYYNWRKKSKELRTAIALGKEITDQNVENALYKSAINGNVTAMIFWLKNRKKDKWSDRQEVDMNATVKPIVISGGDKLED